NYKVTGVQTCALPILKDSSSVSTFTNISSGASLVTSNLVKNITYTAKFECGSIYADEGPLRPGHYDTDLSIFNKQNYQTSILWKDRKSVVYGKSDNIG